MDSNDYNEKENGKVLDLDAHREDLKQSERDAINPWAFAKFKKEKAVEALGLCDTAFMSESIIDELCEFFEKYADASTHMQHQLCENLFHAIKSEASEFYDDNETMDQFIDEADSGL